MMAELTRYLFLDYNSSRERVVRLDGEPPPIGEKEVGVFDDDDAIYEVVCRDLQPYMADDDPIEGGRIWVRRLIQ